MKKSKFIKLIQSKGNYLTQVEALNALNAVSDALSNTLAAQDSINITNIGTFSTKLQKGKSGTLPGSTQTYTTQDKMTPKFSASSVLKAAVAS